ncbi:hypothetical protein [Archaeoglobus sp.]
MKKTTLLVTLVILAIALAGCAKKEAPKYAKPFKTIQETTVSEQQLELLKKVTHASIMVFTKNWDEDAEDDGLAVYIDLKDEKDETVKFKGVSLPVEIDIYTQEFKDFKPVKGRLVYKGTATITSWKDGNFLLSGGIRIPFEDIKTTEADPEWGIIYVKVHLPDGRIIEAKQDFGVRIKPE